MRDASLDEYAAAAESTAQLEAFIQYTQIKEPKTELGRRAVALWKDFSVFWKQKNANYAEKKKESIRDKLNENRQIVAGREKNSPIQANQNHTQNKTKEYER